MERSLYLDKAIQGIKKDSTIQGLNGKIPLETLTLVERIKELEVLVEQLATGLNKQQSELVNLKTFIGFNE